MPGLLERLASHGDLRDLDLHFARFMGECADESSDALRLAAALVSRATGDGHVCIDLAELAGQPLPTGDAADAGIAAVPAPELSAWRAALRASGVVGDATENEPDARPLVLDAADRLYLARYWRYERDLAAGLLARARGFCDGVDMERFAAGLDRLFPAGDDKPDRQRTAAVLAVLKRLLVISGGPGTGKTTTVTRLLALLVEQSPAVPPRIALAAPTGKAAARLNASIAAQRARLDVDDAVREAIPAQVDTLHRLLGARPGTRRFRHDQAHPLHVDVLVIDEASMIDLEMMSAVLAALPASARLVLLGDKDQLSSVEAGAALGDLCQRAEAGHYSDATAGWLREVTGDDIRPFVRADARPLDQHVAMLRYSHRFAETSGIGQLAQAVNAGDATRVVQLLETPHADLAWIPAAGQAQQAALAIDGGAAAQGYRHYLEQLRQQRPGSGAGRAAHDDWARAVLQAFNRFQLLCALRRGPHGVEGLNLLIAEALHAQGLIEASSGWYEGRPVMVTRNDYALGLANGDVGICLRTPDEKGRLRLAVAFLAGTGDGSGTRVRHVAPARLGEVATTYAMTVHKSQGSEFDHTALVLPAGPHPVLTRELLYTGITRARHWFSLLGSEAVVADAVARRTRRHSGLAKRLAEDVDTAGP